MHQKQIHVLPKYEIRRNPFYSTPPSCIIKPCISPRIRQRINLHKGFVVPVPVLLEYSQASLTYSNYEPKSFGYYIGLGFYRLLGVIYRSGEREREIASLRGPWRSCSSNAVDLGETTDAAMALSRSSSPSPAPLKRRQNGFARRCERCCWTFVTHIPLPFVYGLTTWAVFVEVSLSRIWVLSSWSGRVTLHLIAC